MWHRWQRFLYRSHIDRACRSASFASVAIVGGGDGVVNAARRCLVAVSCPGCSACSLCTLPLQVMSL